ncbi:hypothetical protein L0337_29370 [candidate division KSB1 bacterium]|nr:hypothetical protein [candidate division KSB1 bacterium]
MKTRLTLMIALAVTMLLCGCNIFSPFHSDGSSDDPAVLLSEARSALREGREKEALSMLDRAMAKITPATPADQAAAIRYFHAVATVRVNDVSFQSFIDMMQGVDGGTGEGEGMQLFNFTERELAQLLKTFQTVKADLVPVVQALSDGSLTTAQFPYADDAFLSCGVASLVSGFITMMDKDHNPANGFRLDTRVLIEKINDAYQVALDDPTQASQAIHDELVSIAGQSYSQLEDGFEYLWQYYYTTTFGKPAKGKPPVPPAPLPDNIRSTPSGAFIQIVHAGMSSLYHFING